MKIAESLPHQIRSIEHVWITMADGVRLSARVWLPEEAQGRPVPAILEYIPYRKRDYTRVRDSVMHPWFAGHGYAAVRVDLRGSGDSEGVLRDEYLARELLDGCEVLKWIANQPWCNGRVGMLGISWGGFNGLQIAAMRPPELGAVISVCSTDDRYADDVHYMGGCLLGDNLSWASVMFGCNTCPPDPAIVGDAWRQMWRQRLDESGLWLATWLEHQHRDEYWKHGSICEDYAAIQVPVLAASGWADGYSNAVFRMLEHLEVPRKGLIGPWSHRYPHQGVPGPAIGFLQEALRWWDRWLEDIDNGVDAEPIIQAFMQDSMPPNTHYAMRPGRWVAENNWPSPRIDHRTWRLEPDRLIPDANLDDGPPQELPLDIQSPLSCGLFAGKWCSYSYAPDLPGDQREEDGGALAFTSLPLPKSLEILGFPEVSFEFASNRPSAMVALRLSDVAPDDKATRVTYAVFNLNHHRGSEHRSGHAHPQALEPGRRYRVKIRLCGVAQTFPAGHRLRLSLSTSYWPLAWPSPEPVRLTVFTGSANLRLPVRPISDADDVPVRPFDEPEGSVPTAVKVLQPANHNWLVYRDLARNVSTLEVTHDTGSAFLEEPAMETGLQTVEHYRIHGDDFDSAEAEVETTRRFEREGWKIRTRTHTLLTADETDFRLRAELDAFEGSTRVACRSWDLSIPRKLV